MVKDTFACRFDEDANINQYLAANKLFKEDKKNTEPTVVAGSKVFSPSHTPYMTPDVT